MVSPKSLRRQQYAACAVPMGESAVLDGILHDGLNTQSRDFEVPHVELIVKPKLS
jgi:hypothetical protein